PASPVTSHTTSHTTSYVTPATGEALRVRGAAFRTRADLKVEDGCDARCAYCIVPDARGPARSVPWDDVLAQVAALATAGVSEVVLTGVNLGRYADTGRDLADLVRAVAAAGIPRVRLSSIEPLDLTERMLTALAETPQVCAHLHVPLQSGADAVLAAMRRGYTAAQYADAIARARAALPGLAVTTDVIAGFPGESPDDHAATIALCERLAFAKLHVFRYSEREGTPAATMPGSVPPATRTARAADLRAAGERLRATYLADAARRPEPQEVLVERVRAGVAEGTTRDYVHVTWPVAGGARAGDVVSAELRESATLR
ncbi:MAG: MiaB/RimO family radical SAM methylthiotransferase, partial [Actinobacteria bacterium]